MVDGNCQLDQIMGIWERNKERTDGKNRCGNVGENKGGWWVVYDTRENYVMWKGLVEREKQVSLPEGNCERYFVS